ncbi:uncharacterized protein LOC110023040 [Phalaenopsis equestris]|uniref:uncharacterized protein LOC110023040 n=1 Tax=Phalaenopsis equestris TaxID=78828 RepID=UPI0009E44B82|nr:uncharacterized protein LOC110023040 [Phalaenopsis equestris]
MSAKRQVDAAEVSPMLDFRSHDEAWYSVRLRLEGDKLLVMYCDFPQEYDEVYTVEGFKNIESVEEFRKRFRLASSQLQDKNCDVVVKGMRVCAANRLAEVELRFFDAIVQSVNPSIHALQEGECRCKFELLWQHGPLKGKKSVLGIENVCLIKSHDVIVNPTLDKFVDIMKDKLKKVKSNRSDPNLDSCSSELTQKSKLESRHGLSSSTNFISTNQISSTTTLHKSKKHRRDFCSFMNIEASKLEGTLKPDKGRSSSESMSGNFEEDFDMGGQLIQKYQHFEKKRTYYFCRIDNLEKNLSAFTLKHFVQEHLGLPCLAFICPTISREFCTRGFILLEEMHQSDKLMDFLLNREYIIASLEGRPWIIDDACFGIAEGFMPAYEVKPVPSNRREELNVQLKLVHKGTAEYEKIEKVRLLHSEFLEHIQSRLLPRLLADEWQLMRQVAED